MTARLVLVVSLAACGDSVAVEDTFEPTSGTQLELEWHQFTDGTRVVEPDTFYDIKLHARCTPRLWIDGVTRCVPIADEAVYSDATCETAVGRSPSSDLPLHFLAYDTIDGTPIPARLLIPGDPIEPIAEYFVRQEGRCAGPYPSPEELVYFAIVDEEAAYYQVPMREQERGEGRLAVRYREADDGLIVPFALHDRELAAPCTTMQHPELGVVCEPTASVPALYFGDAACTERVIALPDDASPIPVTATVAEPSGCLEHHAVGAALAPMLYRLDGERCIGFVPDPVPRVFAVGAPVELPVVEQEIEEVAGRRLQRIALRTGSVRWFDDRLFDTATRADCRRTVTGAVARCLPEPLASVTMLYGPDCAVAVPVSELPERTCGRLAFAAASTEAGLEIHAVGDRVLDPLYHFPNGFCQPYTTAPDTMLRALGPALAPETFVEAFTFGER